MGLPIRLETRTGDTPVHKRQRQKLDPPDMLLTTPEQVALLIASKDARRFFGRLKTVIFDELHSLVVSKRGDLLSLGLARLRELAPGLRTIGLSATVAEPDDALRLAGGAVRRRRARSPTRSWWRAARRPTSPSSRRRMRACRGPGHTALYALPARLRGDQGAQDDAHLRQHALAGGADLPRAVAHQRRRAGDRAASRLARPRAAAQGGSGDGGGEAPRRRRHLHARPRHRLGRRRPRRACRRAEGRQPAGAAHRPRQPPHGRAVGGPAGARPTASRCWSAARRSTPTISATRTRRRCAPARSTCWRSTCSAWRWRSRSTRSQLYEEITSAEPYRHLAWETFERVVDFVATGGYALRNYERYAKIRRRKDGPQKGLWGITNPTIAQQYRLNVGTIVEAPMLHVVLGRLRKGVIRGGKRLGQIEEYFLETLAAGDTFRFAGRVLRFEGIRENIAYVTPGGEENPSIPSFEGGKFPLTTYLASQVREIIADRKRWSKLPEQVLRVARLPGGALAAPRPRPAAGGDLPARQEVLHGRLPVRGAAGASDARHAPDAAAGARRRPAARLRRDRLFHRRVGAARPRRRVRGRPAVACRALRRGHAGRRPGSVDGGIVSAEAHLPELRRSSPG